MTRRRAQTYHRHHGEANVFQTAGSVYVNIFGLLLFSESCCFAKNTPIRNVVTCSTNIPAQISMHLLFSNSCPAGFESILLHTAFILRGNLKNNAIQLNTQTNAKLMQVLFSDFLLLCQIITALEDDSTAQKMQLGYRLQQIAAAVENKVTDL